MIILFMPSQSAITPKKICFTKIWAPYLLDTKRKKTELSNLRGKKKKKKDSLDFLKARLLSHSIIILKRQTDFYTSK